MPAPGKWLSPSWVSRRGGSYDVAGLSIKYARRRVVVSDEPVELTATENAMLFELAVHTPRVLNRNVLLQRVWGPERVEPSEP